MFLLNFVINGKVASLPKVIKYVKRSKDSFHDFMSAKHMPCAPLRWITPNSEIHFKQDLEPLHVEIIN